MSPEIVNPNGGAVALGHPIGMSGARLALTLIGELRRRGGGLGAAALCGGGGQGDAVILRAASEAEPRQHLGRDAQRPHSGFDGIGNCRCVGAGNLGR